MTSIDLVLNMHAPSVGNLNTVQLTGPAQWRQTPHVDAASRRILKAARCRFYGWRDQRSRLYDRTRVRNELSKHILNSAICCDIAGARLWLVEPARSRPARLALRRRLSSTTASSKSNCARPAPMSAESIWPAAC